MRRPAPASSAKAVRRPAPPRRPRIPAPDEKAAAMQMFVEGATAPAKVAKALGVSRATAYRWWGEYQGEQAALAEPSRPAPLPAATTPVSEPAAEGVRQPAAPPPRDPEAEWVMWLAMTAAHRR